MIRNDGLWLALAGAFCLLAFMSNLALIVGAWRLTWCFSVLFVASLLCYRRALGNAPQSPRRVFLVVVFSFICVVAVIASWKDAAGSLGCTSG
jgi:hypothetical protein